MDITYNARAQASCTITADSRRYDDATIELKAFSVVYDFQIYPIQTTICKENGLVSLVCQPQNFS